MKITVYDDDIGRDAVIGRCTSSLLDVMTPKDPNDADAETEAEVVPLLTKKDKETGGSLVFGRRFFPAGASPPALPRAHEVVSFP